MRRNRREILSGKTEEVDNELSTGHAAFSNKSSFLSHMLDCDSRQDDDSEAYFVLSSVLSSAAERVVDAIQRHERNSIKNEKPEHAAKTIEHLRTLSRHVPSAYADGEEAPSGPLRPSARRISNAMHRHGISDSTEAPALPLNQLHAHFGQFLSHDLSHTPQQANSDPREFFPIRISIDDELDSVNHADGEATTMLPASLIRFRRSVFDPHTRPRQQLNKATPDLDGSVVYGSDPHRTRELRQTLPSRRERCVVLGRLKVHHSDLPTLRADAHKFTRLPLNHAGISNDNPLACPVSALHVAGDSRANIQPGLTGVHTIP